MTEKLHMKTQSISQENIDKIRVLFPNVVTEVIKDGKVTLAVDFDVLKQELSDSLISEGQERYQMTWPDKKKSIVIANSAISATLRPCKEESVDFDHTQNLYIEGDNLDVLKLLRETYLGKVKMIYIDPPYNTGNDFIYNDDFSQEHNEYVENSGQYDNQGNRYFQNTESNGRFHTDWLNMIFPRLKVAKDLLADDGVIFISIDDNEIDNLRKVCNEVFGASSFIANLVWNSRKSVSNDAVVSLNHNHTLVYAKSMAVFYANKAEFKLPDNGEGFENPDNDLRGKWKADPFDSPGIRPNLTYKIVNPNTGEEFMPPEGRCWRTGEKEYLQFLQDGRIVFGKTGNGKPQLKRFLFEAQSKGLTPKSLWDDCGTATDGTREIQDLFGLKIFDTPKPTQFIKKILALASKKDSIILDFFSGSATTAHAVMQLNAEDGGKRKFIMVQLPEVCDEKSEAYKAGYKTICEIGKERIRRAGEKIYEEKRKAKGQPTRVDLFKQIIATSEIEQQHILMQRYDEAMQGLDIGFRVLKLDSSNMQDVYYNPSSMTQSLLDATIDNVKPDRTPMDLLFQIMLELGVELSAKIEEKEISEKKYYIVNDNDIIACFDDNLNNEVITEIAKLQPLYAVFKDKSFATDSVGINNEQIFKTYSPSTTVKVL